MELHRHQILIFCMFSLACIEESQRCLCILPLLDRSLAHSSGCTFALLCTVYNWGDLIWALFLDQKYEGISPAGGTGPKRKLWQDLTDKTVHPWTNN